MKKTAITTFAVFLTAFIIAGCSKEPCETTTLKQGIGAGVGEGTKTSLDDHSSMRWEIGDRIGFFADTGSPINNEPLTLDPASITPNGYWARFTGNIENPNPADGKFYSYYPYDAEATRTGDLLNMIFPEVQSPLNGELDGRFFPMVGLFDDPGAQDVNIMFYNMCSIIKLELFAPEPGIVLRSIRFMGNSGETVSGPFSVNAATYDFSFTGGNPHITYNTANEAPELSASAASPSVFYLVVPPVSFAAGVTFTFTTDRGTYVEKVGETGGLAFSRNKLYEPGVLQVTPDGTEDLNDPLHWNMTSADERVYSNCYVISQQGKYAFDASIIGNGARGITDVASAAGINDSELNFHTASAEIEPKHAAILWQSREGILSDVLLDPQSGRVTFSTTDGPGNAVIAVFDGNDVESSAILWSWHIWVTGGDFYSAESANIRHYLNGTVAMDRNLGAKSGTPDPAGANSEESIMARDFTGLYYQWGRKDALMPGSVALANDGLVQSITTSSNTLGIEGAIRNPDKMAKIAVGNDWLSSTNDYLWGSDSRGGQGAKSIYDPCPVGYRVMHKSSWANFTNTNGYGYVAGSSGFEKGHMYYTHNEATSYFPVSSYINPWGNTPNLHNGVMDECYLWSTVANGNQALSIKATRSNLNTLYGHNRAAAQQLRCIRE